MSFNLLVGGSIAAVASTGAVVTMGLFGDEIGTTDSFKKLDQRVLATGPTTVYGPTVGPVTMTIVKTITLWNSSGSAVTIDIFTDGTAAANHTTSVKVPANGTAIWENNGWVVQDINGAIITTSAPITATGDATGTQVGTNLPLTLATVNVSPGTTGSATQVSQTTVNAKGLVTANTNVSIQIAESQVTNLTADLAAKALSSRLINTTSPLTGGGDLSADRTLSAPNATTSVAGWLTAGGFKKLAGYLDAVADFGFVGDDATDNLAAWNAMVTAIPNNSTLYFPPGTYRFSAEGTLNVDKHIQFRGAGAQISILKIMAAGANLINITGAAANAWYNTFTDLGFASGVTKTAGAHIGINVATAIGIHITRCAFTGHFIGIDAQGSQAGNVSVWDNITMGAPAVNGRGIRINGSVINLVIQNSTINGVPNAGAIAGSANIEINQSGSVQILGCDLIGAINSLLLNANQGGGTSIAAVYCTNVFFDQSGGSTVKIAGANTTNRIKFTQCGIAAGVIGGHALEINGTGSGAVGTATAMPAGISLIDCDIYYAPGSSTASGIHVNGCQDVNVQDTRCAGFSGAGGAGIHVIPSALNQTRVRVNGCRLGPNSNLTINNTVGVQLDVGSSGLGALTITDNDMGGNSIAISDASTIVAGGTKIINNNYGAGAGLNATLFNPAGFALSATEAIVAQIALPANSVKVGTTFAFLITGTSIVTVTTTIKLHVGPLGTTADPSVILTAVSATGIAGGLVITGAAQIATVGGTAGGSGGVVITTGSATSAPAITATGTFNSAVANFVTLGALCSAAGHTVKAAKLEILGPS